MKRTTYFLLATFSLILLGVIFTFVYKSNEVPHKHVEVVLRNIGHQLLLHSQDSTSRVLPVTSIHERTYQLSFENSFSFTPDTLIQLVQRQLAKTNMPEAYIVSVHDCNKHATVFAYEINALDGDLKPCTGREQEKGCYLIQIAFLAKQSFNYAWLLTGFVPIAFIGFYLNRRKDKQLSATPEDEETEDVGEGNDPELPDLEYKQLGRFRFFDQKGILTLDDAIIELTDKEVKALNIFASNPNLLVERDRLRKELWEDEGILVIDRNVDVLVSKLRKKLSGDTAIKIVNVHGKGYKMTIA